MTLLEASMKGLEFRSPDYADAYPIDFAATTPGLTLIMFAGWWELDWAPGLGMELYWETCRPLESPVGGDPLGWLIEDVEDTGLHPPSDADMAARLTLAREIADMSRWAYLRELRELADELKDHLDLAPWIEMVEARPRIDPAKESVEQNYGERMIGQVPLLGPDGRVVDALVVDEYGNAAVAMGVDWLAVFVDDWVQRDERPELETWLAWVGEQRPSGYTGSLGEPRLYTASGSVEDLAAGAMPTP